MFRPINQQSNLLLKYVKIRLIKSLNLEKSKEKITNIGLMNTRPHMINQKQEQTKVQVNKLNSKPKSLPLLLELICVNKKRLNKPQEFYKKLANMTKEKIGAMTRTDLTVSEDNRETITEVQCQMLQQYWCKNSEHSKNTSEIDKPEAGPDFEKIEIIYILYE